MEKLKYYLPSIIFNIAEILVIFLGSMIDVNPSHLLNAYDPILVTKSRLMILVKTIPVRTSSPIFVAPPGIIICLSEWKSQKT